jgi:hypothetical protein
VKVDATNVTGYPTSIRARAQLQKGRLILATDERLGVHMGSTRVLTSLSRLAWGPTPVCCSSHKEYNMTEGQKQKVQPLSRRMCLGSTPYTCVEAYADPFFNMNTPLLFVIFGTYS